MSTIDFVEYAKLRPPDIHPCGRALRDFVEHAKLRVPDIHPCGREAAYDYLSWAEYHADRGDAHEVVRRLRMVRDRIVQELRWTAESFETAHAYRDAYYEHHQANRIAGVSPVWMLEWSKEINQQSAVRAAERAEWTRKEIARYGHIRTLEEYLDEKAQLRAQQQEQTL